MTLEAEKVSISSIGANTIITDKEITKTLVDPAPPDKFYFVHALFILLGLLHFLPYTFFLTANAYWMYKFRNVSAEITDTDARTTLQTHFSPGTTISNAVPGLIFLLASTFYGYKIRARLRVLGGLVIFTFCFVLMTAFVEINTDSWQLGLFIVTMVTLATICGTNSVVQIATLTILSKFPQHYMKVYLIGQGFAGIFNAVLQILSLAIGPSTTTSALIYFVIGSSFMGVAVVLFFFSKHNKCYNYHISSIAEDTKRDMIPFSEVKSLLKALWPPIVTLIFLMLTSLPTHTAITALVVSENYGSGDPWSDKYFVPVITFLYSEIVGFLGRVLNNKLNKTINGFLLTAIMFIRMVVFVPLIYFCNAQPRYHFAVLLPHDWQYIIVLGCLNFTNGYFFNMIFLEVGKLVEPEKVEDAFMVFMSCSAIINPILTPVSLFAVDLL